MWQLLLGTFSNIFSNTHWLCRCFKSCQHTGDLLHLHSYSLVSQKLLPGNRGAVCLSKQCWTLSSPPNPGWLLYCPMKMKPFAEPTPPSTSEKEDERGLPAPEEWKSPFCPLRYVLMGLSDIRAHSCAVQLQGSSENGQILIYIF